MKFWLLDCHLEFWKNISQTFPTLETFVKLNQETRKGPWQSCLPQHLLSSFLPVCIWPLSFSLRALPSPWLFPPNSQPYELHIDCFLCLQPPPTGPQDPSHILHLWILGSSTSWIINWLNTGLVNASTYWWTERRVSEKKKFLGNHKWFFGLIVFKWCI